MVLERVVQPEAIAKQPWKMFFVGMVYALFSFALGFWVFRSHTTLVMITFTAIAAVPFMYKAISIEEKKETRRKNELSLFYKHGRFIGVFGFLFLGFMVAFVGLYLFLPSGIAVEVFKAQTEAIRTINASPTGNFFSTFGTVGKILVNNLGVLLFCLIFSFFYGVGAIFIISWNASVIGAAIGEAIQEGWRTGIGQYIVPLSFIRYSLHGIPEMGSYLVGGLAGGIVSVALIKEGLKSDLFTRVTKKSLDLVAFAVLLLGFAALIEVFISMGLT